MKKDLHNYIKLYNNSIQKTTCLEIIKELDHVNFKRHSYFDYKNNSYNSYDHEPEISLTTLSLNNNLRYIIWKSIEQYILKDINFDWYQGWEGFTQIKYNKYTVNTEMRQHCDHIHDIFDGEIKGIPILTVLGFLNDDYEGGELVMFTDEIIRVKQGDILIFPSNFLYPHKVNLVTKGTRYSLTSWVW